MESRFIIIQLGFIGQVNFGMEGEVAQKITFGLSALGKSSNVSTSLTHVIMQLSCGKELLSLPYFNMERHLKGVDNRLLTHRFEYKN